MICVKNTKNSFCWLPWNIQYLSTSIMLLLPQKIADGSSIQLHLFFSLSPSTLPTPSQSQINTIILSISTFLLWEKNQNAQYWLLFILFIVLNSTVPSSMDVAQITKFLYFIVKHFHTMYVYHFFPHVDCISLLF